MMIRMEGEEKRSHPLYMQLYQHFREEIQTGRLPSGRKLPSIRSLAEELNISKTTVEQAYHQLFAEGYITSRERSGYIVVEAEQPLAAPNRSRQAASARPTLPEETPPVLFDFHAARMDVHSFPIALWRKFSNQALSETDRELLFYGDPQGEPGLRQALDDYLRRARGVNCSPDQILIGAGTQYMITLISQLIGLDGRSVGMEEPGFHDVRAVFAQLGYAVTPIPLEEDGMDVGVLASSDARLLYITPSHQYPCGMVMPYAKRLRLLQWAADTGAIIIEDDYDGEFRYRGKPIPSLQGLDRNGSVIYLGTFSKSLMPAIRTSYAVLPEWLAEQYRAHFLYLEQSVSRLHQKTLQLLIESGEWERHIRKMRTVYQKKHQALLAAIQVRMGEYVQVKGQDAGLHVMLEITKGRTAEELTAQAAAAGIKVYPLRRMYMGNYPEQPARILLGFGGMSVEELQEGVRRLDEAWS